MNEWRKITTKYPSRCITCDKYIGEGEQALWMVNLGIKHEECPIESELKPDNSTLVIIDEDDKKMLGIK